MWITLFNPLADGFYTARRAVTFFKIYNQRDNSKLARISSVSLAECLLAATLNKALLTQ
jgi:hypothetical protein